MFKYQNHLSIQLLSNLKETDITDDSDASISSQHSTMYNFKQVEKPNANNIFRNYFL